MLCELPTTYRPAAFLLRQAESAWEKQAAYALRRAVFCVEQGLFVGDDRDALDAHALTLIALSCTCGDGDEVVGTVRLHRAAAPEQSVAGSRANGAHEVTYAGSRLAVHPSVRRSAQVGSVLIQRAVRTAVALGATRFVAHIQSQNVPLFERLHWHVLDYVVLQGRRHALMQADLSFYPPLNSGERTQVLLASRAS